MWDVLREEGVYYQVAMPRKFASLVPIVRPHEMVERITTKETPSKLIIIDEETDEEFLSRFGLGCGYIPSDYPERLKRSTHHPRTMSTVIDKQITDPFTLYPEP